MSVDKKVYIRMAVDAIRYRAQDYRSGKNAQYRFTSALRELVEKCPDLTREELLDILRQAEMEFNK